MKININDVRNLVDKINTRNGFDIKDIHYNTIGAIRLNSDISGIIIDKVMNEHGGVKRIDYGLTKKEAYYLLQGVLNEIL